MVLEKKPCKKNYQKEGFALPLPFPLHQTLKIQKLWNNQIRKYALLLMNSDGKRNHKKEDLHCLYYSHYIKH